MINILDGYITRKELAKNVGVNERTIVRWTEQIGIPVTKIGNKVLYRIDAVREAIANQEVS